MRNKTRFITALERLFGTEETIGLYFIGDVDGKRYSPAELDALITLVGKENAPSVTSYLKNSDLTKSDLGANCTDYARLVFQTFEPGRVEIWGFQNKDNPDSKIARELIHPGGHDFAIVDKRFLVDPWLKHVKNHDHWIFDSRNVEDMKRIMEIYGDSKNWRHMVEAETQ